MEKELKVIVSKQVFNADDGSQVDYLEIKGKIGIFTVALSPKDKTSKEMLLTMLEEEAKVKKP